MSKELKPCPFCGHAEPAAGEYGSENVPWQIYCMDADCTAEMTAKTYLEAVALWNRRAPDPDASRSAARSERERAARVITAAAYVVNAFTDDDLPHLDDCQDVRLGELREELEVYASLPDAKSTDGDAGETP